MINHLKKFLRRLEESEWRLGLLSSNLEDLKSGNIHWISNGIFKNKWFADPFILDYDDKQVRLLVEEFDYQVHRGRLARLTVNKETWTVEECKIILDLATHLSFPMIWREEGHVYVCPENYVSGALSIYEYDVNHDVLTFIKPLILGKLTDATLFKDGNHYYILSTYEPTPNGKKLSIWKSDRLMGDYELCQDIFFEENIGRNAGKIFEYNGKFMRPAQECNDEYGHAIVFQQMHLHDSTFTFTEDFRYTSTCSTNRCGSHTYNTYKEMAVIDAKGLRYKIMGSAFINFRKLMISLHLKKKFELK